MHLEEKRRRVIPVEEILNYGNNAEVSYNQSFGANAISFLPHPFIQHHQPFFSAHLN